MQLSLARVNSGCGIGKVAGYFVDALSRRLFTPQTAGLISSAHENEILYHHFYEACPYLKFAHFTANQAILEAFDGHECVHVIDFNLMHGLQWPALIQALALRPGGPPLLRLTGIGPPSPDGRDSLREVGVRLAELARSVNVRFAFGGVAASRLEDVKPWMLQVGPKEAVAVNSIMQLHRLLGSDPTRGSPINTVLGWIRNLNPKIVTVVEQEANHNQPEFLDRFTEALHYYSTMFDSLETYLSHPNKAYAEMYIQREICNVLCCDGLAQVERHEPLAKWRVRLGGAGFRPLHLGSNAFKQASMLLTLFSAEGYSVEENEGCLSLGWHSRPLITASAWQAISEPNPPLNLISHRNQNNNTML
jgi:DELLA protein